MSLFKGLKYILLSENSKQKTLKSILGFYPSNFKLYDQAFTHKSVVNEDEDSVKLSNERLEFLGDAILGAIVADYFFMKYPFEDEGFLTKIRSKLVSRAFLNRLSVDLGLDTFIETSANVQRSKSIFGDAFEALIGAIYLDKGYLACKRFVVDKVIRDYVDVAGLIQTESNFKSKLIEWSQSERKEYKFITEEKESEGSRYFECVLKIQNEIVSKGQGNSKKRAEQDAAKLFFDDNSNNNKP